MVGQQQQEEKPGRLALLRRKHEWLDRLIRAFERYTKQYGDYYAAAITYFSVLALVPLLMIAFAIAGFVLAGNPDLLARLQDSITSAVPSPAMSQMLNRVVDQAIQQAGAVGVIGLLAALYSGLGWMTNLREALTAQWTQVPDPQPMHKRMASDLVSLVGLGLALGVSIGISALGGGVGKLLMQAMGFSGTPLAFVVLRVLSIALSLAASWLVFIWVLARLPRKAVTLRSALWGALLAAVGFEILKQVAVIYLGMVTNSPAGAAFGPILGLLVFANLMSRFILFVTAWTASARENLEAEPPPVPGPAVIRPMVQVQRRPRARTAAGLVGLGAAGAWAWRLRARK
ncbi:inner membrane protein YhjD [Saccharopolyspora griseoalba]|uniref:Inner membrane protein YhjD n=1 Tax=Saccharopolyspora griseoalba TaxID=1431848 RepID=A0ABW2LIL5_9PSEU